MKSFEHINAFSAQSAVSLLDASGRSRIIAGGTDILPAMRQNILEPERLVNLKTAPGLDYIRYDEDGSLSLGALTTLNDIAANSTVRERFPSLFQAITSAASPQLRNRGTIGGNLNQYSRCWYYRGPFHCWLKGGQVCYAREGENSHHAVFGGGPCYTVHPSDPPVALSALGAQVRIIGAEGEKSLPIEEFFRLPGVNSRQLTLLKPSDIIVEIRIPAPPVNSRSWFKKAMDRKHWAFALVSIAVQLIIEGKTVRDASLVLGGVAPVPWRLPEVENVLRGRQLDMATIQKASELSVTGARPLRHNEYKLHLIKGLVTESLTVLKE